MSIKLSGLLAGIKRAVVDAHRSVAEQHMEELAQYFEPAPGQAADIEFPRGQWEARSVVLKLPHEASRNGKVGIERRAVHVPLIMLLPLRSHTIERVELLTTLDFSLAPPLPADAARGEADLPPGSAIYFAVDYDATRADIDGPVTAYFSGLRAALNGSAGYRIGVYGSGLCCGAMVDRGLASLGWLSQSGGFCGTRDYAQAMRYDLIQSLGTRISLDGGALDIDPDASNPQRSPEHDPGLFLLAA